MSREPWSDERLRDAYAALAGRPTPARLEEEVMTELRERPERPAPRWWRPNALLPAAAAVTAVAIVAVIVWAGPAVPVASPPTGSLGAPPSPAAASPSPAPSASPAGSPLTVFPDEVLGQPVVTVASLLELTEDGLYDGQVLAVRGWYTPPSPIPCPYTPGRALLEIGCPEFTAVLAERPLAVFGTGQLSPIGPFVVPKFVEGTPGVEQPDDYDGEPIAVVFLGHVGDERASLCPPETRATCERQFVVDRVAWASGREIPLEVALDPSASTPLWFSITVADAERFANGVFPGATVLSVAWLTGPTIRRIEPLRTYTGDGRLLVVRVIGPRPCGLPGRGAASSRYSQALFFTLDGEQRLVRICD